MAVVDSIMLVGALTCIALVCMWFESHINEHTTYSNSGTYA